MKGIRIYLLAAAGFMAVSALLYYIHFLIFQDTRHIFIYLLGDVAYLPLEVFIVVVVIERLLTRREKRSMLYKLNMAIGAFFSEIGNYLLADLLKYFNNRDEICRHLNLGKDWTQKDFKRADAFAYNLKIEMDIKKIDLDELKKFLSGKRSYLLTLLENPNLLEHDRFTDLLWATTHLDEELEARHSFKDLPRGDLEHLAVDIQRMYDHLASEWLDYVQHLKANYPFLYSLVLRTHPFQEKPSAVIA
ncbi:MAG TPA: hypothetical protein VJ377_10300 [Dehalococcoidales bacterium]|nr:hypothetical protein [Dehalococcoidales bacterium]